MTPTLKSGVTTPQMISEDALPLQSAATPLHPPPSPTSDYKAGVASADHTKNSHYTDYRLYANIFKHCNSHKCPMAFESLVF